MTLASRSWAVFISGTGSNLKTLLEEEGVDVRLVVSSRKKAPGILKARRAGLAVFIWDSSQTTESALAELKNRGINAIFLAGYMKILPEEFLNQWTGIILNVHPSLLPLYPGKDSLEKSYQEGAPMGATVHHVIAEVDSGQKVLQCEVARRKDFLETAFFLHRIEHQLVRKGALRAVKI